MEKTKRGPGMYDLQASYFDNKVIRFTLESEKIIKGHIVNLKKEDGSCKLHTLILKLVGEIKYYLILEYDTRTQKCKEVKEMTATESPRNGLLLL